jgi:hypothetical protein
VQQYSGDSFVLQNAHNDSAILGLAFRGHVSSPKYGVPSNYGKKTQAAF